MAKKKDNTLAIAILGIAAFLLFSRNTRPVQYPYPNFPTVPQQPPLGNNLSEFQQWVMLIISLVGPVASLWQPGGPFYSLSDDDKDQIKSIYAAMGLPTNNIPD